MVLFRAPEWLALSSNGTAPASLAPSSCHRGAREPTWQEEGDSMAGPAASIPDHDTTNHKKNLNSNYHLAKSENI
uniref:Uncharacterized protein n=1 Tax=Oryza sativa subsp. japonica TaxID=39947 RepID=Q5VRZ5_ORYSJ|nr:hypothetical protein [Oryza sativa Japonica Group]